VWMQRSSEATLALQLLRDSCKENRTAKPCRSRLDGSNRVEAEVSDGEKRELHACTVLGMRSSLMSCPIRLGLARAARRSVASGLFGSAGIVMDPAR